jgi:hypothetical protein
MDTRCFRTGLLRKQQQIWLDASQALRHKDTSDT